MDDEIRQFVTLVTLADHYVNRLGFGTSCPDALAPMESRAASLLSAGSLFSDIQDDVLATKLKVKIESLE